MLGFWFLQEGGNRSRRGEIAVRGGFQGSFVGCIITGSRGLRLRGGVRGDGGRGFDAYWGILFSVTMGDIDDFGYEGFQVRGRSCQGFIVAIGLAGSGVVGGGFVICSLFLMVCLRLSYSIDYILVFSALETAIATFLNASPYDGV